MARWAVWTVIGFLEVKSQQCLVGLSSAKSFMCRLRRGDKREALKFESKESIANKVKLKA
jgi:hypothetical protein